MSTLAPAIWPDTPPAIPSNLRALRNVTRAAERTLRRIRSNAREERKLFLSALRETLALRKSPKNTEPDTAVKTLERQLRDNAMFSRIRRSLQPTTQAALTQVEIVRESAHLHPDTGQRVTSNITVTVDTR